MAYQRADIFYIGEDLTIFILDGSNVKNSVEVPAHYPRMIYRVNRDKILPKLPSKSCTVTTIDCSDAEF
ncbi:unnamed protein product [Cuscuta campestris]|uniref:Uncharacterized protein n=1 Tax=Cuscuta campestris TaxID=132261 RepID=A0A484MFP3_9ASTE|nr:unnamed protein product [Cuscuta campestris]